MKKHTLLLCLLAALPLPAADENLASAVGYFRATIAAGTGTARKITAFAPPLEFPANAITGATSAALTSVTANTLTVADAGWTPAQFTTPAAPYALKISSGTAAGLTFLLSTATPNSADTLVLAPDQTDLATLGLAPGDGVEILHCDTLAGLLGTPATTGILGGTTAAAADNVVIVVNGITRTHYYNTTLDRWTLDNPGSPDASHTPLPPDTGILYARLAATPLELIITGRVPATSRLAEVKNSGTTLLSQNWPVDLTLAASGLAQLPGWASATAAAAADKVKLHVNGTLYTYWHDGTHWRRQTLGSPISNSVVIPAGTAVTLQKTGSTAGSATLMQAPPYSL